MPIRRKAILVGGDNASASNPLPGATKDIKRLSAYLQTSTGGAWLAEEIVWYPTLRLAQLQAVLGEAKASHDYVFVATMLHGARGPKGSFLSLNDYEVIGIDEIARLGPRAKRVLILSGGCRSELPSFYAPPRHVGGGGDVAGLPSWAYTESCRNAFDKIVAEAQPGAAVMYACRANEESWYINGYGGIFIQALLRNAETWSSTNSNGECARQYRTAENALAVVREQTTAMVRGLGHTQTPEIMPANPPAFPFAIA